MNLSFKLTATPSLSKLCLLLLLLLLLLKQASRQSMDPSPLNSIVIRSFCEFLLLHPPLPWPLPPRLSSLIPLSMSSSSMTASSTELYCNVSFTMPPSKKALELLDSGKSGIDLIFTDYCMPQMSGYELLRRVKETEGFREIPIVVMSSENVSRRIEKCLKEGAEEFILKPVHMADAKRLLKFVGSKIRAEEPTVECRKRKFSSDGFEMRRSAGERRERPSGVIVVSI